MTAIALLWARFMASPAGRWAAIIGGVVLAVVTFGWSQKRAGAERARAEAKAHADELALGREAVRRYIDAGGGDVNERLRDDFRD